MYKSKKQHRKAHATLTRRPEISKKSLESVNGSKGDQYEGNRAGAKPNGGI